VRESNPHLSTARRCLWDVETNNHASAYYTNPYLYCVAMVFACYYE